MRLLDADLGLTPIRLRPAHRHHDLHIEFVMRSAGTRVRVRDKSRREETKFRNELPERVHEARLARVASADHVVGRHVVRILEARGQWKAKLQAALDLVAGRAPHWIKMAAK